MLETKIIQETAHSLHTLEDYESQLLRFQGRFDKKQIEIENLKNEHQQDMKTKDLQI